MAYVFPWVLKDEGIAAEDGGYENLELHVREVLAHACPVINKNRLVRSLCKNS